MSRSEAPIYEAKVTLIIGNFVLQSSNPDTGELATSQTLAQVTLVTFGKLFGQALFVVGAVKGERAGGDEKSDEQNAPLPPAHPKDEGAGYDRARDAAATQRAAPVADHTDEG